MEAKGNITANSRGALKASHIPQTQGTAKPKIITQYNLSMLLVLLFDLL